MHWLVPEGFGPLQSVLAKMLARDPKDRYQTEVESWRKLQSDNIEFTMKRLREPKA